MEHSSSPPKSSTTRICRIGNLASNSSLNAWVTLAAADALTISSPWWTTWSPERVVDEHLGRMSGSGEGGQGMTEKIVTALAARIDFAATLAAKHRPVSC